MTVYDRKRKFYGGNQEWFHNEVLKKVGCSIVAAANITAYIAKSMNSTYLYNYKDMSLNSFIEHMEDISKYIIPDPLKGVTSVSYFNEKVLEFAKDRGVILRENYILNNNNFLETKEFIKKALMEDKPLALLMLNNSVLKEFEWHWVTITKLFEGKEKTYLNFSSWGERRVSTLEDIYEYSSFYSFSYFDF